MRLCLFKLHHIQTVHLLPDLMINSDEILSVAVYRIDNEDRERCGNQAVVTGALSDAMCHRICVFVSLSMPIEKDRIYEAYNTKMH